MLAVRFLAQVGNRWLGGCLRSRAHLQHHRGEGRLGTACAAV